MQANCVEYPNRVAVQYSCSLTETEREAKSRAEIGTEAVLIVSILLFSVCWAFHRHKLNERRKDYYAKQISVDSFTLKANIRPHVWQGVQEACAEQTASDYFLEELRAEIESLSSNEIGGSNSIKIAFMQLENWTGEKVAALVR